MKKYIYLTSLIALICSHAAQGQTLKALSYDVSNNAVAAATNTNPITFRNPIAWATNSHRDATRINLGLGTAATNAATNFQSASTNLTALANGDGSFLTNIISLSQGGTGATSSSNARVNLELGPTNNVSFRKVLLAGPLVFGTETGTNQGSGNLRMSSADNQTIELMSTGTVLATIGTNNITISNNNSYRAFGGSGTIWLDAAYLGYGWRAATNTAEFARVRLFADGLYSGSGSATNRVISLGIGSPFWRIEIAPSFASGVAGNFLANLGLTNGTVNLSLGNLTATYISAGSANIGNVDIFDGTIYGEKDDNDGFRSVTLSPDDGLDFLGDFESTAISSTREELKIDKVSSTIAGHHATGLTPAVGGQTYYFGFPHDVGAATTATERGFRFPFPGKIIAAMATISVAGSLGVNPGTNAAIGIFNKNSSTPTSLAFTGLSYTNVQSSYAKTSLNISVNATNEYAFYVTTPTFSGAPTTVRHYVTIFYQPDNL